MKRRIYSLFIALSLLVVSACDLDLLDDPNAVTASTASLNLVLNRIQVDFTGFYNGTQDRGMRLTRMLTLGTNNYDLAYTPVNFDATWRTAYSSILNDIKFLEPLATDANFRRHLGIARVIKAYVMMTMVDYFNDVPFDEALDPNNFNPRLTDGAAIYQKALEILNVAKTDFEATTVGAPQDLFYNSNWANWIKVVNTMKLKLYLNLKLVDAAGATAGINALIAENNFIQPGQEWVFKYGTNLTDPDSRHPRFAGQYTPGGGGDYQATWFMFHLTEFKRVAGDPITDPRARFYFYRQRITNPTDPDQLRCLGQANPPVHYIPGGFPFCLPGTRGYWGRDHLNDEGIPPDGLGRTAWGVYPAGGRFDNNAGVPVNPTAGAGGAGIHPLLLPAWVDFMLAEAVQTMAGVNGDPAALLASGITKSIDYVRAFSVATSEAGAINTFQAVADFNVDRDAYLAYVAAEFTAAPEARKMYVIGREYWIASYGNGNEAYNLYKRTGQPDGMQPGLASSFGDFPRSFFYPQVHIVTNTNAVQKASQRLRVFWDTNPEGNGWID